MTFRPMSELKRQVLDCAQAGSRVELEIGERDFLSAQDAVFRELRS